MSSMQEDLTDLEYLSIHEEIERKEARGELSSSVDQSQGAPLCPTLPEGNSPASCSRLFNLPDDILAIIYKKQDQESRGRFVATCRQFRYTPGVAFHRQSLTVTFSPTPPPVPTQLLPRGVKTLKLVGRHEELDFSDEDYQRCPVNPAPLSAFLGTLGRNATALRPCYPSAVTTIILQRWDLSAGSTGPSIMAALTSLCPVAELVIEECQFSPLVFSPSSSMPRPLSRLTSLVIRNDSRVDSLWDDSGNERNGYGLNALLRSLSGLTALQSLSLDLGNAANDHNFAKAMSGNDDSSDPILRLTPLRGLTNLQTLRLSWDYWQLIEKEVDGLGAVVPRLRKLELEGFVGLAFFRAPSSSPLADLTLENCSLNVDFFKSPSLQKLQRIAILTYVGFESGDMASLLAIFATLPNLKSLHIECECDDECDEEMIHDDVWRALGHVQTTFKVGEDF